MAKENIIQEFIMKNIEKTNQEFRFKNVKIIKNYFIKEID